MGSAAGSEGSPGAGDERRARWKSVQGPAASSLSELSSPSTPGALQERRAETVAGGRGTGGVA